MQSVVILRALELSASKVSLSWLVFWLTCVPVLFSNFRLLCLCSFWIMSLHLYSVFVSVCLCLFVCLLCQCLFVVNLPLCFIQKSSISSLFTAHCYVNEVSRHTNPSNFGMMKINRGHNGDNICY